MTVYIKMPCLAVGWCYKERQKGLKYDAFSKETYKSNAERRLVLWNQITKRWCEQIFEFTYKPINNGGDNHCS